MTDREDTIQVLYGKASSWASKDLVLKRGEHGFEWDTGKFKIGDGVRPYSQLSYFIPESMVLEVVQEFLDSLPTDPGGGITLEAFTNHVNSATPHPTYDNMASLISRYRNAKV